MLPEPGGRGGSEGHAGGSSVTVRSGAGSSSSELRRSSNKSSGVVAVDPGVAAVLGGAVVGNIPAVNWAGSMLLK